MDVTTDSDWTIDRLHIWLLNKYLFHLKDSNYAFTKIYDQYEHRIDNIMSSYRREQLKRDK